MVGWSWSHQDEEFFCTALRNCVRGTLVIDHDAVCRKTGLTKKSSTGVWSKLKKKLRDQDCVPWDPSKLKLTYIDQRNLIAVYQSLKRDTMVIDYAGIARDTGMSPGGASLRYDALKKKLIDTSNALTCEQHCCPTPAVTPEPIFSSERRTHKADANVPMDLPDKVKIPQDPAEVILFTLTAIGRFEVNWNLLAEQAGISDWELNMSFHTAIESRGYRYQGGCIVQEKDGSLAPDASRVLQLQAAQMLEPVKAANDPSIVSGEYHTEERIQHVSRNIDAVSLRTTSGNETHAAKAESHLNRLLRKPDSQRPREYRRQPIFGNVTTTFVRAPNDPHFLRLCVKYMRPQTTINFSAVSGWRGPVRSEQASRRFARIGDQISHRFSKARIVSGLAVQGPWSPGDDIFVEKCYRYMQDEPHIDYEGVARELNLQHCAAAMKRFHEIMHRLRPPWYRTIIQSTDSERHRSTTNVDSHPPISDRQKGPEDAVVGSETAQATTGWEQPGILDLDEDLLQPDDDVDSLYSESEYLAQFQQDLVKSATILDLSEDSGMDVDSKT